MGGDPIKTCSVEKTQIIAFSDPDDPMSYPVPDKFADQYIESRLCPSVTNVSINVAAVNSLLGLGEVANPLSAHSGYGPDERVGALIARGAGTPTSPRSSPSAAPGARPTRA